MKMNLFKTIFMMVALLLVQNVQAQKRWTGVEVNDALVSGNGTEVFLYNVGTGRFLIHGGDWGVQARFLYDDTGKLLTIKNGKTGSNIVFDTGMSTNGAAVLGCNIPKVSDSHGWDYGDGTFTVLMDAHEDIAENGSAPYRHWTFIPVTDDDEAGNNTYYMCEDFTGKVTGDSVVYMGAAYGETWGNHENNPNGKLVFLAYDRAVWTTMDPRNSTATCENGVWDAAMEGLPDGTETVTRSMDSEVPIFNVDTKIKLKKLYQWRIVTKEQLLATLTNGDVSSGLSTNLTYLINDRGFERNDWSFFNTTDGWVENRLSGGDYSTTGRWTYTWGYTGTQTTTGGSKTQHRVPDRVANDPWNKPLRLKAQWDSKSDAKYGYLEFEGLGTVSTKITVSSAANADPKLAPGVYKVSCYGFYQNGGSADHPAYFFVSTKAPSTITANESDNQTTFKKIALKKIEGYSKAISGTSTTTSKTGVMGAGSDFVWAKDPYLVELEIKVEEGQTLYFGLYKNQTAQSSSQNTSNGPAYYDMDWAGADQFQISYLGTDNPKLLDEDKSVDFSHEDYNIGTIELKNRELRLHRTFQTGKWNSFVVPVDMTAVQVRNAFGETARVAKLDGLGTRSGNAKIIDFVTVSLPSEGTAIKKGEFYLIMPTKEPTAGTASTENKSYYTLGAYNYSGTTLDAAKVVETEFTPAEGAANPTEASMKVQGTYKSTPGYEYDAGNKFVEGEEKVEGTYIPARSYVIGAQGDKTTIFHTKSDLKTKGFRAWLIDMNDAQTSQVSSVAINGINDITAIDEILADELKAKITNHAVYDMSGRKVADSQQNIGKLNKGIYIVNGKKIVIK